MKRKIFSLLLAGGFALSLAACGSETVEPTPTPKPTPVEKTEPEVSKIPREGILLESKAVETFSGDAVDQVVLVDSYGVLVSIGGSSSCPPVIDEAFLLEDTINIFLKEQKSKVCTEDYQPHYFDIQKFSSEGDLLSVKNAVIIQGAEEKSLTVETVESTEIEFVETETVVE